MKPIADITAAFALRNAKAQIIHLENMLQKVSGADDGEKGYCLTSKNAIEYIDEALADLEDKVIQPTH